MKNIVVYESRYGSTEKYAKWIGEELNCKVSKLKDIKIDELQKYDNIIFGGWLHAGSIKGFKEIRRHFDKLKNKNFILFYVGLNIMDEKTHEEIKKKNFENMDIKDFYLRGAFNYKHLTRTDKFMMDMLKKMIKKQSEEEMDENTKGMLAAYDTPIDFTNKDHIKPIIEAVESMSLQ